MTVRLLLLFLSFQSNGYGFWSVSDDPKELLAHSKRLIVNELNRCSPKRHLNEEKLTRIMGNQLRRHWNALRMDLLTEASETEYSKMESCLHHVHLHLQKLHRTLRKAEKIGNSKSHRLRLRSSRNSRSLMDESDKLERRNQDHPIQLNSSQLEWMGIKERRVLSKFREGNPSKWELLIKIGQLFYHSRKEMRRKSQRVLEEYCKTNIENLIGKENFGELKEMISERSTVQKIETKYGEMVGELTQEKDRINAEHYGQFCRKIFRIIHFKPQSLLQWLNPNQKKKIMDMIQDPEIGDDQVYDQVFQFYNSTTGSSRESAKEMIDNGCRRFIAHTFGEDVEEEVDVSLVYENITKQQLAAKLAIHGEQIQDDRNRKLVSDSLPICTRIYVGYDYSCDCNGRSDECHPSHYTCLRCQGNTFGVQCEKCLDGYSRDENGDCISSDQSQSNQDQSIQDQSDIDEKKASSELNDFQKRICECNGHSNSCSKLGKCLNCAHNTDGDSCESCLPGYYGDPREGTVNDCITCPCPNGGECVVNDSGLIECLQCPQGKTGIICEKNEIKKIEESEEKISSNRRRFHRFF